ncbi:MAG: MvaI/BcnI family restriction endonuclease [Nitrosopumilus sp.]|nr:MvaI/BcnI family restriction endonuclease [Nitrosopumilus sp.]
MTVRGVRPNELFGEIRGILGRWYDIPDRQGYRGTGAPGRLLEDLLHIDENNQDLPDAGGWEIKFTGDVSYLTLFHKDPYPRRPSVVEDLVRKCGWRDKNGNTAFRHTIWGRSRRGFEVWAGPRTVEVVNTGHPAIRPYWDVDDLTNAAAGKLRRLIVVFGRVERARRRVRYSVAIRYLDFKFSEFLRGLRDGWICVDFDARTRGRGIRNHGTKFRIRTQDVALMYRSVSRISEPGIEEESWAAGLLRDRQRPAAGA